MKLSIFIFHVDCGKGESFRDLVADYFKRYYPYAEEDGTLTLTNNRLIIVTYDFDWLWSDASCFVDSVLRRASENNILVVCESVKF